MEKWPQLLLKIYLEMTIAVTQIYLEMTIAGNQNIFRNGHSCYSKYT